VTDNTKPAAKAITTQATPCREDGTRSARIPRCCTQARRPRGVPLKARAIAGSRLLGGYVCGKQEAIALSAGSATSGRVPGVTGEPRSHRLPSKRSDKSRLQ
jgi:hypothetical protein